VFCFGGRQTRVIRRLFDVVRATKPAPSAPERVLKFLIYLNPAQIHIDFY